MVHAGRSTMPNGVVQEKLVLKILQDICWHILEEVTLCRKSPSMYRKKWCVYDIVQELFRYMQDEVVYQWDCPVHTERYHTTCTRYLISSGVYSTRHIIPSGT